MIPSSLNVKKKASLKNIFVKSGESAHEGIPPLFVFEKLCETIEILIALIGESDV